MADNNSAQPTDKFAGCYQISNGAVVSVKSGFVVDYAHMRAEQMRALAQVTTSDNFDQWDDKVKSGVRWLLATLAEEMAGLVDLIEKDVASAPADSRHVDDQADKRWPTPTSSRPR